MKHAQILVFNKVEELDFAGPYEVLAYLRQLHPELCDVQIVSQDGQGVTCSKKMRVLADASFETATPADLIIVPGGYGARAEQVNNPVMLEYLKRAAARAEIVASVCTGAFLLHKAGLLNGLTVTTHWHYRESLAAAGGVNVVRERYVDQGKIITAAGVSAGIDMTLHILSRLWSREVAAEVQSGIEYFPQPPETGAKQP